MRDTPAATANAFAGVADTVCAVSRATMSAKLERSLHELRSFGRATAANLSAPDRLARARAALRHWVYLEAEAELELRSLPELFPSIETVAPRVAVDATHPFELPVGERVVLDLIVQHLEPRTIFEFGTYTGTTTALMAQVAPEGATVHTIDLPRAPAELLGRAFASPEPGWAQIVQHRANLRFFDFEPYHGQVDLVFIDASHERDDVLADSGAAFQLLSDRGVIVWDDFQPAHPGVVTALADLSSRYDLYSVLGTRLAVYRRG